MKTKASVFSLILLGCVVAAGGEAVRAGTDWLVRARFGVFVHFLPSGPDALEQVERFDVSALAEQVKEIGAGYLVFTLGQNSGYFNSPNSVYERRTGYAPGERCAKRDLPLELHGALSARGIRLMLYLPCQVPNRDERAQKAFGLPAGPKDQPLDEAFAEKWSEVIREWSDRYGEKVSGWWFDGAYAHIHFEESIARSYAAAAKHGNPEALVSFNPGVKLVRWTQSEDYTAGELNEPFTVVPSGRWVEGVQWHALTYLGDTWGRRNTRFTDAQWIEWARKVVAQEGVFTLDMGPNYDGAAGPIGSLAEAQVKQARAIGEALRGQEKRGPEFGVVIEREVGTSFIERRDRVLDLDHGQVMSVPASLPLNGMNNPRPLLNWMEKEGADLMVTDHGTELSLHLDDGGLVRLPERMTFEKTGAAELQTELGRRKATQSLTVSKAEVASALLGFKTREGGLGVMQLSNANGERRDAIRVRYKLMK